MNQPDISTNSFVQNIWQSAKELQYSAALWRLPKQATKHLVVGFEFPQKNIEIDFNEAQSGFVIAPFDNPSLGNSLFIENHFYANSEGSVELLPEYFFDMEKLQNQNLKTRPSKLPSTIKNVIDDDPLRFEAIVNEAVNKIGQGQFQKVVLSRKREIEFTETPDVLAWFDALCEAYPTAFVSLVFLPNLNQTWLCATPETLVGVDDEGIFKTVALAGTQSAFDAEGNFKNPKQAPWTQKEIEEQAMVSRYIISCFKKIRVREFLEEGPKTVLAGNLMHLRSDFEVNTKEINFAELPAVMLTLLHPTSAVCGMPRQEAEEFIQTREGYDREFYSGFLGPINVNERSDLFVNLRCLKVEANIATLYAGAGITEDSAADKELAETELKMQTLLNVIAPK